MVYKDLGEGEDSTTTRLLGYIAKFGTQRGSGALLGCGGPGVMGPMGRLLTRGYIRRVGRDKCEVTEKGWEFLGLEAPSSLKGSSRPEASEIFLEEEGVDMEGVPRASVSRVLEILHGLDPSGYSEKVKDFLRGRK